MRKTKASPEATTPDRTDAPTAKNVLPPEVAAFLDYVRYDRGRSSGTVETYKHFLKRHFEWVAAAGVDYREPSVPDAEAFRAWLTRTKTRHKRKIAPSTVNSIMSAVTEFYRWLLRGAGRPNPYQDKDLRFDARAVRQASSARSRASGAARALAAKERDVVLDWIRKRLADRPGVAVPLLLMYGAGLRVSEAARVRGNAMTRTSDGALWVTVRGKGGKVRTTAVFDPALAEEIAKYAGTRGEQTIATVKRETLLAWAARCRAETGVDFTTHRLRHTYGTERISEDDVPIDVLQELLGHEDISTTRIYAKTVDKRVRAVVKNVVANRRRGPE